PRSSDCCRSSSRKACGSRTGWPYRASNVAVPGFQALHHYFFSGLSGLSGQSGEMDAAHRHLATKGVRVLWVSRDPADITKDYCLKHGIPMFDVLADPPHRTYVQLGLARVPNTVLVGAEGKVEKVWAGRLTRKVGTRCLHIWANWK